MDNSLKKTIDLHLEKAMDSLKANNIKPFYVETKKEALELAKSFVKSGDSVSHGGSVTLKECGVLDFLKNDKDINYLDRAREGITPQEIEQVYRDTFSADVFFTSVNAFTEEGELYNVDGNSNRVAAMLYGPKSVVVITGYNKLVKNRVEAEERVKNIAAPANAMRLNCKVPCVKTGKCEDCKGDTRICCNYVFFNKQRDKNRMKIIIVGEELGY